MEGKIKLTPHTCLVRYARELALEKGRGKGKHSKGKNPAGVKTNVWEKMASGDERFIFSFPVELNPDSQNHPSDGPDLHQISVNPCGWPRSLYMEAEMGWH